MHDYVKVAKEYARKAVRDKRGKRHGLMIRQAAQRFLDDLKRARTKDCAFYFDPWHANDPCDFIEKLHHPEGNWNPPTIVLHPSQVFFVVQLFGFRLKSAVEIAGYGKFHPRRFTSALYAIARKNAKSTLAAAIENYCLCCEPEEGAQVISAATSFGQAAIVFKYAKRMIEKDPELREHFGLEVWAKSITRFETASSFKPIHAKATTQDGLNPSHVVLDEIHAHKTSDLLNVITSAAGARHNPLWLYTTTEGYTNPGPWGDLRLFAKRLLAGLFGNTADHFLVVFFAVDEDNKELGIKADDEFDESAWIKANPLMDVNPILLDKIREAAVEARAMPSKLAEFRIKRLNRQASTASGWVELTKWQTCDGEVDLDWLAQYPCWGGLDLASTRDITAFRLVWSVDGVLYTHGWRWVPADAVKQRTERGTVPYASWVESGLLIQTEGDVIDTAEIEQAILDACERFNVQMIGFDQWNAADLTNRLSEKDVPLQVFIQGTKSFHPAMQVLERAYISGQFAHGGDQLLNWCASNLVTRRDHNMCMAPDRKRSADKIDDMVALLMAVGVSGATVEEDEGDADGFYDNPIMVGV